MLHVKDIKVKILIYTLYIITLMDNKINNHTKLSSNNIVENANKEFKAFLKKLSIMPNGKSHMLKKITNLLKIG